MGLMGKVGSWLVQRDRRRNTQIMNEIRASVTQALLYQGQEVHWPEKNYENYAKEAYMMNVVAYRCIIAIAQAVSSVDLVLMQRRRGKDVEIEEHEIYDLLDYPNPEDSGAFLAYKFMCYVELMGNAFMERVKLLTAPKALPKELYVLRTDRMKILVAENGAKKGYEYQVGLNSKTFPVDVVTGKSDILHMKTFHPIDDWWGLAPTEPAARDIDTDNAQVSHNMSLLQNQARPGMLFLFKKQGLTDEQYVQLDKNLRENFTGYGIGKNLILEGEDVDAKPYGWNPQEMDFTEGGREKMRRIALGYGVPPMLLGIPGDNTYSNYKEARLDFTETTVQSRVLWYAAALNNWLLDRKSGMYLAPDWDSVPALEPRRAETWKKAETASWLTVNEKRVMTGYDELGPEGDVVFVSSSEIPLTDAATGRPEEEDGSDDEEDTGEDDVE